MENYGINDRNSNDRTSKLTRREFGIMAAGAAGLCLAPAAQALCHPLLTALARPPAGVGGGIVKHTGLLTRKPELSHEEFVNDWIETHAKIAHNYDLPGMVRYSICPVIPQPNQPDPGYDGYAESWFTDMAAAEAYINTPGAKAWGSHQPQLREFTSRSPAMGGYSEEIVLIPGPGPASANGPKLVKHTGFLKRNPDLTHEEFVKGWMEGHAQNVHKYNLPDLRRYCICTAIFAPNQPEQPYDGYAELWFDDVAAGQRFFKDPVPGKWAEDMRGLTGKGTIMGAYTDEIVLIPTK